jgi:adenosylhomocysteine nucleosidase
MIAITFALQAESSDFVRRVGDRRSRSRNSLTTIEGKVGNHEIEIMHTGVGEKICHARLPAFLQEARPQLLISAGFAGAVGNDLAAGDLILSRNFSDQRLLTTSEGLLEGRPVHVVKLLTTKTVVDSSAAREEIGRASGAAAVDMETEIIAAECAARGIPLLSLRAISDTPARPLPAPPDVLFDLQRQRTNFPGLSIYVLRHPMVVPRLIGFARQVSRARQNLTDALVAILCGGVF